MQTLISDCKVKWVYAHCGQSDRQSGLLGYMETSQSTIVPVGGRDFRNSLKVLKLHTVMVLDDISLLVTSVVQLPVSGVESAPPSLVCSPNSDYRGWRK